MYVEFSNFCIENGTKRKVSASTTPQQNEISLRRNKSFVNCARLLLVEKGVAQIF